MKRLLLLGLSFMSFALFSANYDQKALRRIIAVATRNVRIYGSAGDHAAIQRFIGEMSALLREKIPLASQESSFEDGDVTPVPRDEDKTPVPQELHEDTVVVDSDYNQEDLRIIINEAERILSEPESSFFEFVGAQKMINFLVPLYRKKFGDMTPVSRTPAPSTCQFVPIENPCEDDARKISSALDIIEVDLISIEQNIKDKRAYFDKAREKELNEMLEDCNELQREVTCILECIDLIKRENLHDQDHRKRSEALQTKIIQIQSQINAFKSITPIVCLFYKTRRKIDDFIWFFFEIINIKK